MGIAILNYGGRKMNDLSYAKKTLKYYMRLIMIRTWIGFNSDDEAEINGIMEDIEDYINDRINKAIAELKESLNEKV